MSTFEIRVELHEAIREIIEENSRCYKICREPSKERFRHHYVKAIAVVDDETSAELLLQKMNIEIERANRQLHRISNLAKPINYKTNTIKAVGDVTISKSTAQRRYSLTGKQLKNELKLYEEELKESPIKDHETIEKNSKLMAQIKDRSLYICAIDSGMRYYANYYEKIAGHRHHVSVGDVLIIIGKDVSLTDAQVRKERSDKSVQIGHFCKKERYYAVYNYDMRFIKRRNNRRENSHS